jgi:hypothetical protein
VTTQPKQKPNRKMQLHRRGKREKSRGKEMGYGGRSYPVFPTLARSPASVPLSLCFAPRAKHQSSVVISSLTEQNANSLCELT